MTINNFSTINEKLYILPLHRTIKKTVIVRSGRRLPMFIIHFTAKYSIRNNVVH
jgi:hypothetical protein